MPAQRQITPQPHLAGPRPRRQAQSPQFTAAAVASLSTSAHPGVVQVEATIRGLESLQQEAASLAQSAGVLADNEPVVTAALRRLGLPGGTASDVAAALASAPDVLSKAPDSLGVAIEFLQVNLTQVHAGDWGWERGVGCWYW